MTYALISCLVFMFSYCIYSHFVTLQTIKLSVQLTEKLERMESAWAGERKDLYSRLMSKDLADYTHHTNDKVIKKKPSNYLEEYRNEAFRQME